MIRTEHKLYFNNAQEMREVSSETVNLIVTSPPYPMIKMWDEIFSLQNSKVAQKLEDYDGNLAFELMHQELDKVWEEIYRVLSKGGIACINIGDATRTVYDNFQVYTNHVRILTKLLSLGFHALPSILWIKESNKPTKFMGSGMLPVGAYVTLEHEYILILRKVGKRIFDTEEQEIRRSSAFFWEERNLWFSDKWKDIKGIKQELKVKGMRERSAAYPFNLAYRLINMYSIQGDVVLDPFLGTGTTTLAAMASTRNSIGFEVNNQFKNIIHERIKNVRAIASERIERRLTRHKQFVKETLLRQKKLKYTNENYQFPVMTKQEKWLKFPTISSVISKDDNLFEIHYS